ncbi:protein kinase [Actinoplanes sp. NPDC020271]|uniref:serine/threonine-protein kinase n=1 Tax=Actinoplanes sp. NPDC020271 TaxID=3363896 RepID=UPI003796BB2D
MRDDGDQGRLRRVEISDNEYGKGLVLDGRYRLTEQLGAGGMGVVWRAHDHVLDRSVAVKLVAPQHAGDRHSRERIRHEARAAAALAHPNIAQVYDYGETDQHGRLLPYLVIELVPGGTLHQRMAAGPVAPAFAMRVCAEVAAALSAAHAEGLVHRDIKPGNVMLAPSGAKVVDFGIAAAVDPVGAEEPDEELLGTPAYLAPERLVGAPVVPASDVYALGVVLYVLLSGHSPWTAENTRQMLTAHVYVEPAALPYVPGVPAHVVALCNRCLAKDPAVRPTAQQIASELGEAAGLRVVPDDLPVRPEPSTAPTTTAEAATTVLRVARNEPAMGVPAAGSVPAVGVPAAGSVPAGGVPAAGSVPAGGVPAAGSTPAAGMPVAQNEPAPGRRAPGVESAPTATTRRGPLLVAAGAVTLAAVAGGFLWFRAGDADDPVVVAAESLPPVVPPPASAAPGKSRSPEPQQTVGTGRSALPPGTGLPVPAATEATKATKAPVGTSTSAASTAPVTTKPTPGAVTRTLSSSGGTVTASCTSDGTAELLSWTAAKTYKLDGVDPGPGPAPTVSFKHGSSVVTMTVACSDGVPAASVSG